MERLRNGVVDINNEIECDHTRTSLKDKLVEGGPVSFSIPDKFNFPFNSSVNRIIVRPFDDHMLVECIPDEAPYGYLKRRFINNRILPQNYEPEYLHEENWRVRVGFNPNDPSKESFGVPEAKFSVQFTGHSDKMLEKLFGWSEEDLKEAYLSYTSPDTEAVDFIVTRSVIAATKPTRASLKIVHYDTEHSLHSFNYGAHTMLLAELSTHKKKNLTGKNKYKIFGQKFRLCIATVADADQLLRVYQGDWYEVKNYSSEERDIFTAKLADLFTHPDISSEFKPETLLSDISEKLFSLNVHVEEDKKNKKYANELKKRFVKEKKKK